MKQIQAIHNHIVFQFNQDGKTVTSGDNRSQAFQEKTEWGFEFHNFDESTNQPRWGKVVSVGPDVTDELQPGTEILIENLKWTNHVIHNNQKYWRTDDTSVLAYKDQS